METIDLPENVTAIAPDGSEIRELVKLSRGSMVHCRLPPGGVAAAVRHRSVQEVWYVLNGTGEVWRSFSGSERVDSVSRGISLSIETGAHFQFRNTGNDDFEILIVTMPPWTDASEAERVPDHWPLS